MKSRYVILCHLHELTLKGKNRGRFERKLYQNIRIQLGGLPFKSVSNKKARVVVSDVDASLWSQYSTRLKGVMGIIGCSLMKRTEPSMENIKTVVKDIVSQTSFESFRVSARRSDKNFPIKTPDINIEIGSMVQELSGKPVSLKKYDCNIAIEIIEDNAFIGVNKERCYGGLPVGSTEKGLSLLSSGIDSPVASFHMIRRGMQLDYVHFHSAPATSPQSIENVEKLVSRLCYYQIESRLYIIPLLKIQEKIMKHAVEANWVILFRRAMLKLATKIAHKAQINALVTGESVGQVSSQTISNIRAVDEASDLPILRPLSGTNKDEIMELAKKIETYDISNLPHQDCCSFFLPPSPETKAKLDLVLMDESKIDLGNLMEDAENNTEIKTINYNYEEAT